MSEETVTVTLLPEDDTEAILEKVRRAKAKKINLIVPPGTRALQTLGGFTMLRKACDITGLEITIYSTEEKTCDLARVCRFEVVRVDQEVRPREVVPPPEPPRIVVSTRPPEPAGVAPAPAAVEEVREEAARAGLSEADLALFEAPESMSLTEDVELRREAFARPAPAPAPEVAVPPERPAAPRARPPRKPSPLAFLWEPLAGALANIYIAIVGLFLRTASRFQPRVQAGVVAEEAPAVAAPRAPTAEERRVLGRRKMRYYLVSLLATFGFTLLLIALYVFSLPQVTVALTPLQAEEKQMDIVLTIALTDTLASKGVQAAPQVEGETVRIPAKAVQVELERTEAISTTGEQWIADGTATGVVVFVNLTGYGINVPAGTRLSGGGATFHTTQDVWVPGSDFRGEDAYLGKGRVNVVADVPGSAGNVPAGAIGVIEGDLSCCLTVENGEATAGGSERHAVIVTAEDQARLRERLLSALQQEAYSQLQAKLSGLEVLSGTLQIETLEETFSQSVGAEARTLTLRARVRASALASAPALLGRAVETAVEQKLGGQKAGQEIGTVTYGPLEAVSPGPGNTWAYRTVATVPILNRIDEGLKAEIAGRLRGKSYQEARRILESYRDRIADYAITPVLDFLPSLGGIQVVDISGYR
ncbi:MAG: baseplate J/gp47 family protein [Chloroflexia bacterium]